MRHDLFNRPLENFLAEVCEGCPELQAAKGKVNAVLLRYEESCGHYLRVSDLYLDTARDDGEVLAEGFINFVDGEPPEPGRSEKRRRQGAAESKSILRRFIREFRGGVTERGSGKQASLAGMEDLPEEWLILKKILTHDIPGSEWTRVVHGVRSKEDFPYSFASAHLVRALREVSGASGVTDLSILFGELYTDLTRALKRNAPYPRHRQLAVKFSRFRKAYFKAVGLLVPSWQIKLPLEEFPEPLRSQVKLYEQRALLGFGASQELRRVAREHNFKTTPYSETTVRGMVQALEIGLGHIFAGVAERPERLSIEDLVKTRPVEVRDKNGEVTDVDHVNEYVGVYRREQWDEATPSKRAEYDTVTFEHFRVAVCLVAAVNGCGEYVPNFRKGYRVQLDRETRRLKKSKKKRIFKRPTVDKEILRLYTEVISIIKVGSFKTGRAGRDLKAHKRVTKVLLVVSMAVLRYLGYRQQCLRDCKLGENIIFNRDGSITLDFPEDVTKNGKHIRITLNKRDHGHTHGLLIDLLWLYHDYVYPYVLERDEDVQGSFFVAVSPFTGLFRRFKDEGNFKTCFEDWGRAHLRYEKFAGAQEANLVLHPHFFRGCCVDWLLEDVGMSRDEVADFIGDEPETLKEYINANRVRDPSRALARRNRELRAEQAERDRPRLEAEFKAKLAELGKLARAQESQLQLQSAELTKMRELLEREKNEKDSVVREKRELERRLSSLEVEVNRLRREAEAVV